MGIRTDEVAEHGAEISALYRACAHAENAEALLSEVQPVLLDWLNVDAVTLALVDDPAVLVVSRHPLTTSFMDRVRAHACRCLEGKSKLQRTPEDIVVQQVGTVTESEQLNQDVGILWTGALESQARLLAVVTFYREESAIAHPSELARLRQVRSLVCDALVRILNQAHSAQLNARISVSPRRHTDGSDVMVLGIRDARLIRYAFGDDRLREIQEQLLDRIGTARRHSFLIARLGNDRIIVVDHPGQGLSHDQWREAMHSMTSGIEVGQGIDLEYDIEIGSVEGITGASTRQDDAQPNPALPTPDGIDAMAV